MRRCMNNAYLEKGVSNLKKMSENLSYAFQPQGFLFGLHIKLC